jgi:hypothetical protein
MNMRMILATALVMIGLGTAFITADLTWMAIQFNTVILQEDRALSSDHAFTLATYQATECRQRVPPCTPDEARQALLRFDRGRLIRAVVIGGAVAGLGMTLAWQGFRQMLFAVRKPRVAPIIAVEIEPAPVEETEPV